MDAPLAPAAPAREAESLRRTGGAPVIRLDRVSKEFRPRDSATPVTALRDVSLDVGAGEIVGIIGRSGAGKSTLVRLINGLEQPSSGTVWVDGTQVSGLRESEARASRRRIGMVFQHFNLLSSRTVEGNVALPIEIAGARRSAAKQRVGELLDLVGLGEQRGRYPAELSGGQKQRVGIARALANAPKVLLCDEATSALDPETTSQILDLLARIRDELGVTIILITHEMAVVKSIADRVAVLEQGRVIEEGETFAVFSRPQHPTTRSFISTLASHRLPESIARLLHAEPQPQGRAVVRILFTGPQAEEPVLSRLGRLLAIDVNILSGQVETIGGRGFGTLVVAIPSDAAAVGATLAALARMELQAEVLGYVA